MNGDKSMENIFNMAMVFGISLMLLLEIVYRFLNYKWIDKISDDVILYIIHAGVVLFVVFLCFLLWSSIGVWDSDKSKGYIELIISLLLVLTAVTVYYGFLTRKQMKMEENKSGGTEAELKKLDSRIKASEFVINNAGTIAIAAFVLYFVFC